MRYGFIREEKDIKSLILFGLSLVPFAITESDLLEIVLVDDGFGYFEFSEAMVDLLASRHIASLESGGSKQFVITPKGAEVVAALDRDLPFTVRDKAQSAALQVILKVRREASLKTSQRQNDDGTYTVSMKICDKDTEHLALEIMAATPRQCELVKRNFKENAEKIFQTVVSLLAGGGTDK